MLKKKILALLAAVALACGAVGCKADTGTGQGDTSQTVQETEQATEQTAEAMAEQTEQKDISKTFAVDTLPNIQTTKENPNIIIDEEKNTMYYFFKNNETVNLSAVENLDDITSIKIVPLEDEYHFNKILGFAENQNTDKITELSVFGGELNDLSFLNSFSNISSLSFLSCKITNSSAISNLNNLLNIVVEDCEIDNIIFLSSLHNLRGIYFLNTPITKIPYLTLIKYDDVISDYRDICFQNCGELDISGLSGLKESECILKIILTDNVIRDFSPLAEISSIHELDLSNTSGSDYSTMQGISAGEIWLDNCNLSDIGFLSYNEVRTLSLSNNNISDWSPLLEVESLVWCWTFDNPMIMPDNIEEFEKRGITLADSNQWAYPY